MAPCRHVCLQKETVNETKDQILWKLQYNISPLASLYNQAINNTVVKLYKTSINMVCAYVGNTTTRVDLLTILPAWLFTKSNGQEKNYYAAPFSRTFSCFKTVSINFFLSLSFFFNEAKRLFRLLSRLFSLKTDTDTLVSIHKPISKQIILPVSIHKLIIININHHKKNVYNITLL